MKIFHISVQEFLAHSQWDRDYGGSELNLFEHGAMGVKEREHEFHS